jgi:hypothetical protein
MRRHMCVGRKLSSLKKHKRSVWFANRLENPYRSPLHLSTQLFVAGPSGLTFAKQTTKEHEAHFSQRRIKGRQLSLKARQPLFQSSL